MREKNRRMRQRGFTLIEVMIVVAVVSILTAIAMPSYNEYIRRGHRADARAGLLQAAQWMERAATAGGVYPANLPNALRWLDSGGNPDPTKRYTISVVNGNTGAAFTLRAVPKSPGPQAADKCGTYTLSNTGVQGANGKVSGDTGYDASCWGK